MTEAAQEQAQVEQQQHPVNSYEAIRDSAPISKETHDLWLQADRGALNLQQSYENLSQDTVLTDEARARRAQELYEQRGRRVIAQRQQVRDALLKAVKSAENSSFPMPGGEGITTTDANKLLASQNEADRIVRTLERRKERDKIGGGDPSTYLKQEYERGLEIGGVEGGAICRGALRAAEEMGQGTDWLPRGERHIQQLDIARRLFHASGIISTEAPKPPKKLQAKRQRGSDFNYRPRRQNPFADRSSGEPTDKSGPSTQLIGGRRSKRPWK
jgi:hypothetical protein